MKYRRYGYAAVKIERQRTKQKEQIASMYTKQGMKKKVARYSMLWTMPSLSTFDLSFQLISTPTFSFQLALFILDL